MISSHKLFIHPSQIRIRSKFGDKNGKGSPDLSTTTYVLRLLTVSLTITVISFDGVNTSTHLYIEPTMYIRDMNINDPDTTGSMNRGRNVNPKMLAITR